MAKFEQEFRAVVLLEGGYSNHPADAGGETVYGISRRAHPQWQGWLQVDAMRGDQDFPACALNSPIVLDATEDLYRADYWEPIHGDDLTQPVACELFEATVNIGRGTVVRYLQRALNALRGDMAIIAEDGIFGLGTLARIGEVSASHEMAEQCLLSALNSAQCEHYIELAHGSRKHRTFIIGWLANRVTV